MIKDDEKPMRSSQKYLHALSLLKHPCFMFSTLFLKVLVTTTDALGHFSAAFDTVDHAILLSFLENYVGLSGSVLSMLESYLQGRTQCVSINNILSDLSELVYGVPQGSVLGPTIFCTYAYTIPLGAILRKHNMQFHLYADDTELYCASEIDSCADTMKSIESCISDIRSWMISSKLKINDDKTEFLVISSSHLSFHFDKQLTIGDATISQSSS